MSESTARPGELTRFISISLDVCASTGTKVEMDTFVEKYGLDPVESHAVFGAALVNTERRFLNCMYRSKDDKQLPFELERLFLIKAIGDEWWYTYGLEQLDEVAVGRHARQLLDRLLAFLSKQPMDVILPARPESHPDGKDEYEDVLRIGLPVKVTMDLVHGYDLGAQRKESFESTLAGFVGHPRVTYGNDAYVALVRRLGAVWVTVNADTGKATLGSRSDFIGSEIDRFFRLTKEARQGRILVGGNLVPYMDLQRYTNNTMELDPEWHSHRLGSPEGAMYGDNRYGDVLATDVLVFDGMKGIPAGYRGMFCTDGHSRSAKAIVRPIPLNNASSKRDE